MYIYAEIATSGVNNWAILRDWHVGVLTKLVISYPILELASICWYHWMCNIQEGTIHMLTYSYTERNQPQIIKIRATPTFLLCLSPRVKCTQHPVWCRSLTFMLCSLYPVYLGCPDPSHTGKSLVTTGVGSLGVKPGVVNVGVLI